MQHFPISPKSMIDSFWQNRHLILSLTKRDVIGRYRGSLIGIAWSLLNPLIMLIVYTFVFSIVFKARWNIDPDESKTSFALFLFLGLIIHGLFAECVNRAPGLILSNVSYVKRVVFPLEVFPWISFGSSLFHALVSGVVLIVAQLFIKGYIPWTAVLLPFILLPLFFASMGFAWFLSALGVYLRDITQVTGVLTTVLLFVSAVFYPIHALPEKYQIWVMINPLALTIELGRGAVIAGKIPDLNQWGMLMVGGFFVAWVGYAWFQKTRKGFADVL